MQYLKGKVEGKYQQTTWHISFKLDSLNLLSALLNDSSSAELMVLLHYEWGRIAQWLRRRTLEPCQARGRGFVSHTARVEVLGKLLTPRCLPV